MSLLSLVLASSLGLAAEQTLSVGAPASLFTLPAINEDVAMELVKRPRIALSDFTGVDATVPTKAVVLYFFDQGTGGDGLESINRLQRRYGGKGVHFVGVSNDQGEVGQLSTWLGSLKLAFPVVWDNHGVVKGRYMVDKLPMTVVIDGEGYLFAVGRPPVAELEEAVAAELEPLLQK